jgi:hypothetical protein
MNMTLHRATEPAMTVPKFQSKARAGTWTSDLRVIAQTTCDVLRDLRRGDLDESTWNVAVLWWTAGESPDAKATEPLESMTIWG